jgi:D-alanyl-D-alanine carboxypeptidase (penicillin-binding protein 5/6)
LIGLSLLLEGAISQVPQLDLILAYDIPVAQIPVVQSDSGLSRISAPSYFVMDLASASLLVASQAGELRYPASTLKLLTATTILNQLSAFDVIVLTQADLETNQAIKNDLSWQVGESVSVESLVASLLINSDNLSAQILAAHYPGGAEALYLAMADLAKKLNLAPDIKISNAIGFDAQGQLLSARDLAILAKAALTQPLIRSLVATKRQLITTQTEFGLVNHSLINTNGLLFSDPAVRGVKTGTTELAGEVLITQTTVKNHPILVVVMGSLDRYSDTLAILTWVTEHYRWQSWSDVAYNEL